MNYKFFIMDKDPRWGRGVIVWFKSYRNSAAAKSEITRTARKFFRVYGHMPDKIGAEYK